MIRSSVSIEDVIEFLNGLIEADRDAAHNLVEKRVACTEELIKHPTVQVRQPKGEKPTVGLLGVLNGIFGIDEDGWGPIVAYFDDEGTLERFQPSKAKR